jgi:hypothetical protein
MVKKTAGEILEKSMRKKLIYLYEEYIKNPKDEFIKNSAVDFDMEYPQMYKPSMNNALNKSWLIYEGKLTLKEAKEILESLKKEEEEDKD